MLRLVKIILKNDKITKSAAKMKNESKYYGWVGNGDKISVLWRIPRSIHQTLIFIQLVVENLWFL